jgi:ABC-type transport system involved in multi-copper enzyme maturation permease subunit
MRQFLTIAINAFMELVRQPVYLLLMTTSAGFAVFLAAVPYFGFGDDPKLVKDMALAVTLLSGLLGAVLCASTSVAQEIRSGTALTVLAKPVGRARFILAKYAGLAATLALLTFANLVASLLASRMAFDAYGEADVQSLLIYFGAVIVAYAVAGFVNFFLGRPFVANAVFALVVLTTLGFVYIAFFTKVEKAFGEAAAVDWRLVPAGVLILFALWILAAFALACSTRLDVIPTLAICSGVFVLGLMSDYLFGRPAAPAWRRGDLARSVTAGRWTEPETNLLKSLLAQHDQNRDGRIDFAEEKTITAAELKALRDQGLGGAAWAAVLYAITPNWQLFWMADALEGKKSIPWLYVGKAAGYLVAYVGAALAMALLLFEDRELG